MKKIKIFGFPSHQTADRVSGVDYLRIIQPLKHLSNHPDFEVKVFDPFSDKELTNPTFAVDIFKEYDIIYMNYILNDWGYANIAAMARKFNRKIVFDMDDSLWDIRSDNPAYNAYKPGSRGITILNAILEDVDYITCTNKYLRNVILNETYRKPEDIQIFPNYIDPNLYKFRGSAKESYPINIYHFGSTTHFASLEDREFVEGMDRIMKEYPNVVFHTIGANMPKLREMWGQRYVNSFGHRDVLKWIEGPYVDMMKDADIFVTPLSLNRYNRCKSSTKFNEVSIAKKPGVWQRIRQYEEVVIDGKNGFLADSADKWYENVKLLIDSKEKRQEIGENAYKTVENEWNMAKHVEEYANFFKKILLT